MSFSNNVTLDDVLIELDRIYGKKFLSIYGKSLLNAISKDFNIFLNNEYLSIPNDSKRTLRSGDFIMILRPISGG